MSGSANQQILIGYVGKDAEFRPIASGGGVLSFSVATTERWKDKQGKKQERTDWHRIELWGAIAEAIRDYVKKGRLVYVAGSTRHEEWTDKDGAKRNMTKVRADTVQLLGGRKDGDDHEGGTVEQPSTAGGFQASDDDVPF